MIPVVRSIVLSKYAADNGAGGLTSLLTGGMWIDKAPEGTALPYCAMTIQAVDEDDSKGSDGSLVDFAFNIYTDFHADYSVADSIAARLRTVFQRSTGTASFQSITWRATFQAQGSLFVQEPDYANHHIEQYRATVYPNA